MLYVGHVIKVFLVIYQAYLKLFTLSRYEQSNLQGWSLATHDV